MSMTAKERAAEAFSCCHYRVIRNAGVCQECFEKALRAHAHAALEEAARLVVDDDCITCHDEIAPDMREHLADAIRALREEG